jgi:putative hydrolase of the HAD superfamily
MIRALLTDLDDTLYDYAPCEAKGRAALRERATAELGLTAEAFDALYARARDSVKARCPTPSSHSRLLYLHEALHELAAGSSGAPRLALARALEDVFWDAYLSAATLRDGGLELLRWFRARGGKVAIVTDLTLDVQLRKLQHFGLMAEIDALVASEEVGADKPAPAPFILAAQRLGVPLLECAVVGDSAAKDGGGAAGLGLPFFLVRTPDSPQGLTLREVTVELAKRNAWTL